MKPVIGFLFNVTIVAALLVMAFSMANQYGLDRFTAFLDDSRNNLLGGALILYGFSFGLLTLFCRDGVADLVWWFRHRKDKPEGGAADA